MSRLSDLKHRVAAVELLDVLRKNYDYRRLSQMLGLPAPVISRYVHGRVLPSFSRSEKIISVFKDQMLTQIVDGFFKKVEDGIYDVDGLVSNTVLLRQIAKVARKEFNFVNVQKILTVATNGIPVAVHIANEFNAPLVVIKKGRDVSSDEYVEHRIVRVPPLVEYFYMPRKAVKRGEQVLIVDDILRTGATVYGVASIAERSGAKVVGVFAVASVGESAEALKQKLGVSYPIKSIINLSQPTLK